MERDGEGVRWSLMVDPMFRDAPDFVPVGVSLTPGGDDESS